MYDLEDLLARLGSDPETEVVSSLKHYEIELEDVIRSIRGMLPAIMAGTHGNPDSCVLGGFLMGLEYASIYNLEKSVHAQ